jgi:hypothetical protein
MFLPTAHDSLTDHSVFELYDIMSCSHRTERLENLTFSQQLLQLLQVSANLLLKCMTFHM